MPSVSPSDDEYDSEEGVLERSKPCGIHEQQVTSAYDDGYEQDECTGKSIPRRLLTNFKFKLAENGDKASLDSIKTIPLLGEGTVIRSGKEGVAVHFVATEWSIEYGIIIQLQDKPQLWVKSRNCWYKLQEPSDDYKELLQPTLHKAAMCTALVDILDNLQSTESDTENDGDYDSVLSELLSRDKSFTEQYLLSNRDFVIEQLNSVDIPPNGFIPELKRKKRDTNNRFSKSSKLASSSSNKQISGKKRARSDSSDSDSGTSESSSDGDGDGGSESESESESSSDSDSDSDNSSSSGSEGEVIKNGKKKRKLAPEKEKKHTKTSNTKHKLTKKSGGKGKKGDTSKSKASKKANDKKEKEKAKLQSEKKREEEKQKAKEQREKQREEEKEKKRIEKEKIKQEAKRYPMDDTLLEKKMRKEGQKIPSFPEPVPLPFPVPPQAIGGVLLVWEFANTFRKVVGLARNSFAAEDLASGLSPAPVPENLTLVIQVHVALLSFLLAEGREDEDEEKTRKAPERLRLAYEQLRKVPITHSTWFEVLRQFMELLNEEDGQDEQEGDATGSDSDAPEGKHKKPQKNRPDGIEDAVIALGTMEYEALPLEHKLVLLETLCYEAGNTPLFRKNIAQHLEIVEALRKEKRSEELKLKEKRKAIETNVKKMVAEQREKDSGEPNAVDTNPEFEKATPRLHLRDDEERTRQASSEHRKLEVEQKRLESAKRLEDRSIKAAEAKFASAITKESRLLRTQCIGQDRNFRRYWIFAGGKGRGFCAGRLLVEHVYPYSAVVDEQRAQEGSKRVRWSYYSSKEKILEFMGMLNQKGIRELALYKSLVPIVGELRAYGTEDTSIPNNTTTTTVQTDYNPPSLERLRDIILDFKDRIPEGVSDSATLEKRFAESKENTVDELARLLRELEHHLTDTMLTEEWPEIRDNWRQSVKKASTTAQVAVLLSQLESAVKLIANAKGCTVCRGTGDESRLLLCDTCEDEYHTYCLHPPLTSIPRGEWVCPSCKEKRPDENDDLCAICRGRGELLCCDYCSRAYHLKCVDPPLSSIPRGKWGCMHCVENLPQQKNKDNNNRKNTRNRTVFRLSSRPRRAAPRIDYSEL